MDVFGIPTRDREKTFVRMLSWWSGYQKSRVSAAFTPMIFAYHSALALCAECCSPLLRIAVAEHRGFAMMSFITSVLVEGPVNYTHEFEGVTTFAASGVPLPCREACSFLLQMSDCFQFYKDRCLTSKRRI